MKIFRRVLLVCAAALFLFVSSTVAQQEDEIVLGRPLAATLRFAEGRSPLRGEVLAWGEASFRFAARGGEEERIEWAALEARVAYEVRRRLLPRDESVGWIRLGALMLRMGDTALAERAFTTGVRRDGELATVAERAKALHAEGKDPGGAFEENKEKDAAPAPRSRPGGGGSTGSNRVSAWPEQSDEERAAATEEMKERCAALMAQAGMQETPLAETEYFLLYGDLSRKETRRITGMLDDMYTKLLDTMDMDTSAKLYYGKCAVFLFNTRNKYVTFVRDAFDAKGEGTAGMAIYREQRVHVAAHRERPSAGFLDTLVHEAVHTFMRRYRSSAALPTWANEGLADFIAAFLVRNSQQTRGEWSRARQYILTGGSAYDVITRTYVNNRWPGENGYVVSHMMVRFMIKHEPRAFREWIDDIKDGKDAMASMEERFNVDAKELARLFEEDIRREATYTN